MKERWSLTICNTKYSFNIRNKIYSSSKAKHKEGQAILLRHIIVVDQKVDMYIASQKLKPFTQTIGIRLKTSSFSRC